MRKIALLLFAALSISFIHKYYVSKTLIQYDQQGGILKITTQIFIDDLEEGVFLRTGEKMFLKDTKEHPDSELWIEEYINDKLVILINSQKIPLRYLGNELEDDVLYCYLEYPNVSEISSLEIKNDLLMEVYGGQKNIVDFEFPTFDRRVILFKDRPSEVIL